MGPDHRNWSFPLRVIQSPRQTKFEYVLYNRITKWTISHSYHALNEDSYLTILIKLRFYGITQKNFLPQKDATQRGKILKRSILTYFI